ncbi:hypothetical protein [uncultured Halomonas sp.]|uniref:hypothetical protein n=1 Tax=uncultured Halomonas sp. TaxID=173971 RepID=UPI00260745C1|nr:hypothetical protein [uncultured Halomonas sp.]
MPLFQHRFGGGLAAGDVWQFTWWADHPGGVTSANNDAVAWLSAFWGGPAGTDGYGAIVTADVTATTVTTGEIDIATGQQISRADAVVTLAGTAAVDALPADVAIVVSLRTTLANRRGRGRFYLPQPSVQALTATGRMEPGIRTQVLDALDFAWQSYTATGSPVVYSRTGRFTTPVSTYDIGDLFDTQRGRENALVESRESRDMP